MWSIRVAGKRPAELAHTFVVLDWALLGIALALSGGAESWLLVTVPFLAMGQLAGAPRGEWPFLVGPALLLVVVLVIADPSLAGSRFVRRQGGRAGRRRLRRGDPAQARPAAAHRRRSAPKVDESTGLSTGARLPGFLETTTAAALEQHRPLSVVFLRLEHYEDSRNFLGARGQRGAGPRRRPAGRAAAGADGRAFSVRPTGSCSCCPASRLAEARQRPPQWRTT